MTRSLLISGTLMPARIWSSAARVSFSRFSSSRKRLPSTACTRITEMRRSTFSSSTAFWPLATANSTPRAAAVSSSGTGSGPRESSSR
ncbi:hypothetical protein COSO111634_27710 [Corallococcus soli]